MNKGRNILELDMQRNVVAGSPEALRKAIKKAADLKLLILSMTDG